MVTKQGAFYSKNKLDCSTEHIVSENGNLSKHSRPRKDVYSVAMGKQRWSSANSLYKQ